MIDMVKIIFNEGIDLSKGLRDSNVVLENKKIEKLFNYIIKKWKNLEASERAKYSIRCYISELTISTDFLNKSDFMMDIVKYMKRYKKDTFSEVFNNFGLIVFQED